MPEPIKIRATLSGDTLDVRVMAPHPMESGQRRDASNQLIPAHHIERLLITLNGKPMVDAELGGAVAKNPMFGFKFRGARAGDKIGVSWVDTRGEKRSDEALVIDGSRN